MSSSKSFPSCCSMSPCHDWDNLRLKYPVRVKACESIHNRMQLVCKECKCLAVLARATVHSYKEYFLAIKLNFSYNCFLKNSNSCLLLTSNPSQKFMQTPPSLSLLGWSLRYISLLHTSMIISSLLIVLNSIVSERAMIPK